MKILILSAIITLTSTSAFALAINNSSSDGNGAAGALIVLVVIGAIIALNGGLGDTRGKADATDTQDDDDILMKF